MRRMQPPNPIRLGLMWEIASLFDNSFNIPPEHELHGGILPLYWLEACRLFLGVSEPSIPLIDTKWKRKDCHGLVGKRQI